MTFHEQEYLGEMRGMVDKAIHKLKTENKHFEIYSLNIWTDPNAAASSISFDTKKNSEKKVTEANEWSKKYSDRHNANGDLEQAKLFEPITRNCNPAEFEL
jgi:hypothetical protein